MRRREAVLLFREICECIPDAFVTGISLIASDLSEEFELRMNLSLNAKGIEDVQSLVSRHGLQLKEDRGTLVIYGPKLNPSKLEIFA